MCAVCPICLFVYTCPYLSQTGWSALLAAVYMGHVEIVLRLLEAGARPDIQDKVLLSGRVKRKFTLKHVYKCFWVIVEVYTL